MSAETICGMPVIVSRLVPPGQVILAADPLHGQSAVMASTTLLRIRFPRSPIFATRTRDMQAYERAVIRARRHARDVVYLSPSIGASQEPHGDPE